MKAFSNKVNFILCNRAVKIFLKVKHLFVAHYILPWSQANQSTITVPYESIIFFLHRPNPLGILERLGNSEGFRDSWSDSSEALFWVGFEDDNFREGLHGMMV